MSGMNYMEASKVPTKKKAAVEESKLDGMNYMAVTQVNQGATATTKVSKKEATSLGVGEESKIPKKAPTEMQTERGRQTKLTEESKTNSTRTTGAKSAATIVGRQSEIEELNKSEKDTTDKSEKSTGKSKKETDKLTKETGKSKKRSQKKMSKESGGKTTNSKGTPSKKSMPIMPDFAARRKSLILKMVVVLVLVIVIAAIVTGLTLYFVIRPKLLATTEMISTIPISKPKYRIQIMTDVCSQSITDKFKGCWYFEHQFVNSCTIAYCRFIGLTPYFKNESNKFKLAFRNDPWHKNVAVPDGTPCKRPGKMDDTAFCEQGTCQPKTLANEPELAKFINHPGIVGGWKKSVLYRNCLRYNDIYINKTPFSWRVFMGYGTCSFPEAMERKKYNNKNLFCINRAYEFRDCISPLPSLGGKPCWKDETELKWYEWPLYWGELCKSHGHDCKEPSGNLTCNAASPPVPCNAAEDFQKVSEYYIDTTSTFEFSCEPKEQHKFREGRCMIGQFVAVNTSYTDLKL